MIRILFIWFFGYEEEVDRLKGNNLFEGKAVVQAIVALNANRLRVTNKTTMMKILLQNVRNRRART